MPWTRRKAANLGRVTLDQNYTAASGTMELTTGDNAFIPTTGTFWLAWSEDETDPDAVVHLFRVTAVSGDDVTVTAETAEGGGDTNITAGAILRVVSTIGAVEMLGLVFLEEKTASASATLDFTTCISSVYDTYEIVFVNVLPATDGAQLLMRMSTDGGSSYDSGGNYQASLWAWHNTAGGFSGEASGATSLKVTITMDNTDANYPGADGTIRLYNPGSNKYKQVAGQTSFRDSANGQTSCTFKGTYLSTTAVNAFRFLFSSGNITSGTIRVYGLAKT